MTAPRLKRYAPEPDASPLPDEVARALIAETSWYHRFELRPGLWSGGGTEFRTQPIMRALGVPRDLRGLKVLDVGAWDGPATFEMERRGATAYALDIQDPTRVGFATARRVIGSRAVHYEGSVYALPAEELSDFDQIMFRGVFYHLKYPLLAFECLAAALKPGGILYFEGEGFLHYAETLSGASLAARKGWLARLLSRGKDPLRWVREAAESEVPICLAYPNRYKGASNWFIPNAACLRGWLEAAGFEVLEMQAWQGGATDQRLYGRARKVRDAGLEEHPFY